MLLLLLLLRVKLREEKKKIGKKISSCQLILFRDLQKKKDDDVNDDIEENTSDLSLTCMEGTEGGGG